MLPGWQQIDLLQGSNHGFAAAPCAEWWWGVSEREMGSYCSPEPWHSQVYPCDQMGCGEQPPSRLFEMLTSSIRELSVHHSGDGGVGGWGGWDKGIPHFAAHQRHHQRGQISCSAKAAKTCSPPQNCPQHSPRADSFLVLMILAAYSCPASTFTHLRTMEKAPLGRREDGGRGEGLGMGKGTAHP